MTWVVVLLRLQLAVVYLFAFLWKLHPDWVSGQCCRLTFISFEEQGVSRGIPWGAIARAFPPIFQARVGVRVRVRANPKPKP